MQGGRTGIAARAMRSPERLTQGVQRGRTLPLCPTAGTLPIRCLPVMLAVTAGPHRGGSRVMHSRPAPASAFAHAMATDRGGDITANGAPEAITLLRGLSALPAPATSRWTDEAESHTRGWVRSFGLVRSERAQERFDNTQAGTLAGRIYASAATKSDLLIVTDWLSWLFVLDDQLDEGGLGRDPRATEECLRPLKAVLTGEPSTCPSSEGPTWRSAERHLAPAGAVDAVDLADEVCRSRPRLPERVRVGGSQPGNRPRTRCGGVSGAPALGGAIWPSLDLLEFVTHEPLPDLLHDDLLFTELRSAAADVVCWTDDILTVEKERARGDVHNFVIVLQHANGCTDEVALARVAQYIDLRLADFSERERRVPDLLGALELPESTLHATRAHRAGLRDGMRGHLDWGIGTIRYNEVEQTAAGATPSYLEQL